MDYFPLKKVIWRDGDIISESHFYNQERWVESMIGMSFQHHVRYGMFRNPILQDMYNRNENITFHHIEGAQYRVDVELLQLVNQMGQVLKIDARQSLNLIVQFFAGDDEGRIMVYLLPEDIDPDDKDLMERNSEEIQTGTRLYSQPCKLSTTNDYNNGVPIMRFKVQGNVLDRDETFIPFGLHMDSSTACMFAHDRFIEKFQRYKNLLSDYLKTLRPTENLMQIWEVTTQLYRLLEGYEPAFLDKGMKTIEFFRSLQQYINLAKAELRILSIGYEQDFLRQKTADALEILETPLITIIEQQYELSYSFQQAERVMDGLMKHLEFLPAGPISEKDLPIQRVEFSRVAGFNKLTVFLEKEMEFSKGESLMTVYLRSYTRSDPAHKNVRVSLGDVAHGMLRDFLNSLKPMKDEKHSYRIECPKEAINRTSASIISIYVPTPIGEGVPDLKGHLKITIRG